MKEVNLHNPALGKDKKDRDSRVQNIVSELTIIKEQVGLMDSRFRYWHSVNIILLLQTGLHLLLLFSSVQYNVATFYLNVVNIPKILSALLEVQDV